MDKHNKMLIDATHPEETRVVVLRNGRVEEFDYESAARKLLRGNIYLAKVTRVEPSLQAAFVDYGGNRHGFLAFNEIHPDYYQIPVADREALKQEEAEEEARAEAEADERAHQRSRRRGGRNGGGGHHYHHDRPAHAEADADAPEAAGDVEAVSAPSEHGHLDDYQPHESGRPVDAEPMGDRGQPPRDEAPVDSGEGAPTVAALESVPDYVRRDEPSAAEPADALAPTDVTDAPEPVGNVEDIGVIEVDSTGGNGNGESDADQVEQVTTEEDALEELPERPRRRARQYKIQEVIKRRQIILVQVVKEERGNKGAALTTYISLAGRYTVLMPNTGRGGGISRKITQPQDRKRLKAIAEELDVPEGMGLIIRTAGAARTKQEIKRDYEYLLRLWESVRELTLTSTAPCLVYEEGNLIKRSIRDLYSKDIDQVVVAGDTAYHEAHDFMGMLMPGHADNVARYDAAEPLFTRFGIERQLNAMFSPYVTLRSGGYLVINQTEALVAIDVNSGKSTREFSIEETALNTNMEAAEEIARQLKLRDLAGLIVIDFIDMEEKRNNRSVERRLKDALRHDRARIQIGRISHFGLLEMSRQRLRTGVLEGSTSQCPHCQGTGIIRSTESVALAVLRGLEDQLLRQPASLVATTTASVALYILNHKRPFILDMEERHGISVAVEASDRMQGANFSIERVATPAAQAKPVGRAAVSMDWGFDGETEAEEEVEEVEAHAGNGHSHDHRHEGASEGGEQRSGRRRRRRRGRRDREGGAGSVHAHDVGEAARTYEPEAIEAGEPAGDYRDDRSPEYVPSDADYEPVPEMVGEAGPETPEGREPRAEGDNGERRRRGRRRGRRGGRGRGHEGVAGQGEAGASPFVGGPVEDSYAAEGRHEFSGHATDAPIEHGERAAWEESRSAEPNVQRISIVETATRHEPVTEAIARESIIETVDAHQSRHEHAEPVRVVEYSEPAHRQPEAAVEATAAEAAPSPVSAQSEPAPAEPERVAEMRVPEERVPAPEPAAPPAAAEPVAPPAPAVVPEPVVEAPASPPRRGWWQRRFGG